MPNKPRPRCPQDGAAMVPLFRKRARGSGYARAGEAFPEAFRFRSGDSYEP